MEYYVIREGWNAANQSSMGTTATPQDNFESNRLKLVAIVQADSSDEAKAKSGATVYNGQTLFTVINPRAVKGLTREIRKFKQGASNQ